MSEESRRDLLADEGQSESSDRAAAAHESPEWLRAMLATTRDAIILIDARAHVTVLNPVAQTLTGWTRAEAVGSPVERIFHLIDVESRDVRECSARRVLRGEARTEPTDHALLVAKDGTERRVKESAVLVRDSKGSPAGAVLAFREIGDQQKLAEQEADALAYANVILATLGHPFLVLDGSLTVKSANAAFYRQFQTTDAQTIGRHVSELGNGAWSAPALRTLLERVIPHKDSVEDFEVAHDFPGIGHRVLQVNARRIWYENDDAQGLVLMVMVDVTERQRLAEELRNSELRYRRLFQSAKDGILILDAETGKIIDANAFMAGLTGQDLSELLGKELHEIGLFEDAQANKSAFEVLRAGGYVRYDHLPIQNKNGATTAVEFVSNVYPEGRRTVAQCNIRDISARVAMERQLKRQTQALADQHRRKDEFLAMLSHELRNPLAPIRSATHLLRLQERGNENPIAQQAREVIERQVANLTRLVSDLLEVSRVINGRIRLRRETLDLCEAVRHALGTTAPLIARQGHELTTTYPQADGEPLWVHADPTRLEQVIVNLITNAAKFTEPNGRIAVSVERLHNHAVLRVRDSGIGIDAEMLPHLFDLFAQADRSLHRSQGGLGIGLSIVQRLVEMHGGTVEAHSDGVGKGSEFVMRLPVGAEPGHAQAPLVLGPGERETSGMRVLVVDDNVDGCVMLAHLLQLQGYGVRTAHTGPDALTGASAWLPDVVLLDIGLPQLDGYEVARRLRADPAMKRLKLVALTGYGNETDLQLAREAGFDAHLLKPVDLAAVQKLLRDWSRRPAV